MSVISKFLNIFPARHGLAVTVRNNLVAAIQNLSGAKMYISISLPYCDTEELQTLRTAATHILQDSLSQVTLHTYCRTLCQRSLYTNTAGHTV